MESNTRKIVMNLMLTNFSIPAVISVTSLLKLRIQTFLTNQIIVYPIINYTSNKKLSL